MFQDLYVAPVSYSEKNAAEVTLPENPNSWPNEIMQELYKQVNYIADFEPQVVMDRVDAERGYGFGHVEVQNKTELQSNASDQARQAVGVQQVRVPVIIKDRKLQPFDVIITAESKALPLTEGRMRQALFRPQAFDVTSRTPGDMSMVGQLYPPQRTNYGFGGGGVGMSVGMGKEGSENPGQFHDAMQRVLGLTPAEVAKLKGGSTPPTKTQELGKKAAANIPSSTITSPTGPTVKDLIPKVKVGSILRDILPTIEVEDFNRFNSVLGDRHVGAAYVKNAAAVTPVLQCLSGFVPTGTGKTAAALESSVVPTVVQVRKLASGYSVKMANHHYWAPREEVVDRGFVVDNFGVKVALAADETGSVTLADNAGVKDGSPEAAPEVISSFGVYRVKDSHGQELVGFVFPNLLDTDGTALPIALFTNGSVTALQSAIAGESVGKDSGLLFGPAKGHGMFVRRLENGSVDAMLPMTIKGGYSEGGTQKMHVETFDGREMFVAVQPNIQRPTLEGDVCLVPESFLWLSLGGGETELVERPEDWGQQKEAARASASVRLRAGGSDSFSLEGVPLQKLGSQQFLSLDDTLFLLAGLGTDLTYGMQKVAESIAHSRPVDIRVGWEVKTAGSQRLEAMKTASERLSNFPDLRVCLVKEAAYIPDPLAVDTVLSVGFINPENIMTFVSYLPQMDQVQANLCELLIAARLGLQDVPVNSLEKCIRSLEGVIEGLRVLAFQKA